MAETTLGATEMVGAGLGAALVEPVGFLVFRMQRHPGPAPAGAAPRGGGELVFHEDNYCLASDPIELR